MGLTHFDEAPAREFEVGHIAGRWTGLGDAAGSVGVGVRRIQVPTGSWSTPVHDHGSEEELFYVLGGRGLAWYRGRTAEVGAGDCILSAPRHGGHTLHSLDSLDVLAFGPRHHDESVAWERLGLSGIGSRITESQPYALEGVPRQFVREAELGPPELPEPLSERPATIVNLADVEPVAIERPRVSRTRRNLGRAVGSVSTGLQHVSVLPGKLSAPLHCHSLEEELFVVLDGEGMLLLDSDETQVRPGNVVARPPGTGVAHAFRAGAAGLTYLAYGTREPGDVCYYPTSNKVAFRGIGVIARLQSLDYWDGED